MLYFVLNHVSEMIDLWRLCMLSLQVALTSESKTIIDILIMTNKKDLPKIQSIANKLFGAFTIRYAIVSKERDYSLYRSRVRRFEVFSHVTYARYDHVMYMDYDCIVHRDLVKFLPFDKVEKNILYTYSEDTNHNKIFYSFSEYNMDEIMYFKRNNIHPFSTGFMLFRPCKSMKMHFDHLMFLLTEPTNVYYGKGFYEQSLTNMYFNKLELTNTSLLDKLVQSRNIVPNTKQIPEMDDNDFTDDGKIVVTHFCGIGFYKEKYKRIKGFLVKIF